MEPTHEQPLARIHLRHLMVFVAGGSVLFAIVAGQVRNAPPAVQVSALVQGVLLMVMIAGCLTLTFHSRRKVEAQSGPTFARVGRYRGKIWHWLILLLFLVVYLFGVWAERQRLKPGEWGNYLPSPVYLFFLVNYLVVRVWWRIDPTGLEACQNGLIFGGIRFIAWTDMTRFTWSGKSKNQLNLYANRAVMNLRFDPRDVDQIDGILREHVPSGARVSDPSLAKATGVA